MLKIIKRVFRFHHLYSKQIAYQKVTSTKTTNQQFCLPFLNDNKMHLQRMMANSSITSSAIDNYVQSLKSQCSEIDFKQIQHKVDNLYSYIKNTILKEDEFVDDLLKEGSHYYFKKEGKKLRPIMIHLLAQSITNNYTLPINCQSYQPKVYLWSALIQVMHIASLAHDDIIDDSPSRRGQQSQHLKYGKKLALFSANYIISKASNRVYEFGDPDMFRIYSIAMNDLANGEIIQMLAKNKLSKQAKLSTAITNSDIVQMFEQYMDKTYYKTGALMSNGLRGVPLVFRNKQNKLINVIDCQEEVELFSFRVGQHFGLAFQIVDDILDYTSTEEEMGKEPMADLINGHITSPIYLSLLSTAPHHIIHILINKHKTIDHVSIVKQWIVKEKGIQKSYQLAIHHIKTAFEYLQKLKVSPKYMNIWKYLAYKVLNRRK